jgi:hypothetical protein
MRGWRGGDVTKVGHDSRAFPITGFLLFYIGS